MRAARRHVYRWRIFSDAAEAEIHFMANGDGATRVEPEHRGWDAFDDGATPRQRNQSGWRPVIVFYVRPCPASGPVPPAQSIMSHR